jgi:tetratricopeptide (TPR) repeat protein
MPWIEFLIVLAVVYVLAVLVRAIIQLWFWFSETFVEPRQIARLKEQPRRGHDDAAPASSSAHHREKNSFGLGERILIAVWRMTNPLAGLWEFLKRLFTRKDYTYWVGLALGEGDPEKKVTFCSKAVRLNPGYEPAWGLKALTLLDLKKYEQAIPCLDKVLELRPSATAWCRKGLCCYHLGRYSEAIACFDKALVGRADKDRQLFDEGTRYRKLAAQALTSKDLESRAG